MNSKNKEEMIPFLEGNEEFTKEFAEAFNKETDRGAAILAATILDDSLQQLLRKSILVTNDSEDKKKGLIKSLFEYRGSFDSFSSKIDISYILGAIDEDTYRALHVVRNIRNMYAHEHCSSFDEEKIQAKLFRLGELLYPTIKKSEIKGFISTLSYLIYKTAEDERLKGSRDYFDHCISTMQARIVREIEEFDIQFDIFSDSIFALLKSSKR